MEKYKERKIRKNWILLLLICIFFNGYKFLNTEGNENPLLGITFNMIIILAIIIFIYHKKVIINKGTKIFFLGNLGKYLKKRLKWWKFKFKSFK